MWYIVSSSVCFICKNYCTDENSTEKGNFLKRVGAPSQAPGAPSEERLKEGSLGQEVLSGC